MEMAICFVFGNLAATTFIRPNEKDVKLNCLAPCEKS